MKFNTTMCALAVSAVSAVLASLSNPLAAAEPGMNGSYLARYGNATNRWTVTSTCNRDGCFAHVASSEGWSRDAQFVDQRWVIEWIGRPDGVVCADGDTAPATDHWWWDGESLVGEFSSSHGAVCGNPPAPPGQISAPFSLVRVD